MIVFGRIEPFPCKDIDIFPETFYIIPVQSACRGPVGKKLLIGQIGAGGFLEEQFAEIGDRMYVRDCAFGDRVKKSIKGTVEFCVAVPENKQLVLPFFCQAQAGINHAHSIA